MNFWWDLYDKYEDELEKLSPEDRDEEDLDEYDIDGECPVEDDEAKEKKKKPKKKPKKVGKLESQNWI